MTHGKQVLRVRAVMGKTGMGRSLLYKAIAVGAFPRPVKIGPQAVGWISEEVDEWITSRVRERDVANDEGGEK